VLFSGTLGCGKTTVGEEIAELLRLAGEPHAFVDLDALREQWPPPEDDPWNFRLTVANLAAIAVNLDLAGVRSLVLSGVVESRQEIEAYERAIGGGDLVVARVVAPPNVIEARLHARHQSWDSGGLAWHLARAPILSSQLDKSALESFTVANVGDPRDAARIALAHLGWTEDGTPPPR